MRKFLQRTTPPILFWTGMFILASHFFGTVGTGVVFILWGVVQAL